MKTAAAVEKVFKLRGKVKPKGLYICAVPQGISGFPKPAIPAVVTGARAKRDMLEPWVGVLPMIELATFRLEDGRLPEYQKIGGIDEAVQHLKENPYNAAYYVVE